MAQFICLGSELERPALSRCQINRAHRQLCDQLESGGESVRCDDFFANMRAGFERTEPIRNCLASSRGCLRNSTVDIVPTEELLAVWPRTDMAANSKALKLELPLIFRRTTRTPHCRRG